MKLPILTLPVLAVVTFALASTACVEKKGPMEEAGENLDEAAENVTDSVKDATN